MTGTAAHHYRATCTWSGSTASGYDNYDRTHRAAAPPAKAERPVRINEIHLRPEITLPIPMDRDRSQRPARSHGR